jgi:hypothetical protein
VESGSTKSILDSQLSHLGARVDAVYAKACKGVHDNVTLDEAVRPGYMGNRSDRAHG